MFDPDEVKYKLSLQFTETNMKKYLTIKSKSNTCVYQDKIILFMYPISQMEGVTICAADDTLCPHSFD